MSNAPSSKASSKVEPKILIVEGSSELRELLFAALMSELGYQVLEASNGEEAKEKLRANPEIALVVCDYRLSDMTGGNVFEYIKEKKFLCQFFLMSSENPENLQEFKQQVTLGNKIDGLMAKPFELPVFIHFIKEATSKMPVFSSEQLKPFYCPVKLPLLKKFTQVPSDFYIKLSEGKYIRVASEGDPFTNDDYQRFVDKGVETLCVERDKLQGVLSQLGKDVIGLLKNKSLESGNRLQMTDNLLETFHDLGQTLGFSKDVAKVAVMNAGLVVTAVKSNPKLASILAQFGKEKSAYIPGHSNITSYIACGLASEMEWKSDQTYMKLSFASILHDITLPKHEIAQIQTLKELAELKEKNKITKDDAELYLKHPLEASKLIAEFPNIPPDVDLIILQHHERPDGSGFPHKLSHTRIAPLSALFIVAHDLAHSLKISDGKLDIPAWIEARKEKYTLGSNFKKVLQKVSSLAGLGTSIVLIFSLLLGTSCSHRTRGSGKASAENEISSLSALLVSSFKIARTKLVSAEPLVVSLAPLKETDQKGFACTAGNGSFSGCDSQISSVGEKVFTSNSNFISATIEDYRGNVYYQFDKTHFWLCLAFLGLENRGEVDASGYPSNQSISFTLEDIVNLENATDCGVSESDWESLHSNNEIIFTATTSSVEVATYYDQKLILELDTQSGTAMEDSRLECIYRAGELGFSSQCRFLTKSSQYGGNSNYYNSLSHNYFRYDADGGKVRFEWTQPYPDTWSSNQYSIGLRFFSDLTDSNVYFFGDVKNSTNVGYSYSLAGKSLGDSITHALSIIGSFSNIFTSWSEKTGCIQSSFSGVSSDSTLSCSNTGTSVSNSSLASILNSFGKDTLKLTTSLVESHLDSTCLLKEESQLEFGSSNFFSVAKKVCAE